VIAAVAASLALRPEARDARMLVESGSALVAVTPEGTRAQLLADAQDGAYSPDGTMLAFARGGDLWVANADGSGQRRLLQTPNVVEWGPSWSPDGQRIVYTARVGTERQIRVVQLPTGPSVRIAASSAEEWSAEYSRTGRLAFVSTRGGTPVVYVALANGIGARAFDTTPPATPPADVRDLAWSPDGSRLAYTSEAADGTTSLVVDDGTTQLALSATPAHDGNPVWSPTGSRIAYDDGDDNLQSVAADGTDLRALGEGQPLDWLVVPVGTPKWPNLVQRAPSELVVTPDAHGHWLLGFTSMVDNRGPGVLWIRGNRVGNSHVMQVRQLVQLVGGGVRVLPHSGELHYAVAPPHYHWHFLGFDRYELRSTGDFRLLVRDHKSGFCIADHYGIAPGIAHGPPRFLGNCAQFHPEARFVEEGASVGYTDRYPAFFHGQALDITKVSAGRYWLVHRANSDFHLRESYYGDDAASLLVQITWPGGHRAPPSVTPLRACAREHC
jgi:dipeptidyl aminopeptidase/acylaminoacyl peptidase